MERNKLLYFAVGAFLIVGGYIIRSLNRDLAFEGSFVFISMGMYFILALIMKKSASWALFITDYAIMGGLQGLSKMNFKWYNLLYASDAGRFVIGGPFNVRVFIYILIGVTLGAILELVLRQHNSIGLGS